MATNQVGEIIEKFTFYWKVDNLCYNTLHNGEHITSPNFTLPHFLNTTWRLELYPNGLISDFSGYISCLLSRTQDEGPNTIDVKYSFTTSLETANKSFKYHFQKNTCHGDVEFLSHDTGIQRSESILIICKMQFADSSCPSSNSTTNNFIPSMWRSDLLNIWGPMRDLKTQIDKRDFYSKKKLFVFPTRSFARSRFVFKKSVLECPIDTNLIKSGKGKQIIPVSFSEKDPSFVITLNCNKETYDKIDVEIRLVNHNDEKSMLVICQLSVLIDKSKFVQLLPQERLFCIGQKHEVWKLEQAVNMQHCKQRLNEGLSNSLDWKFEFIFTKDQVESAILWEESVSVRNDPLISNKSVLSNQMFRMYKENLLCDVDLKVKNKIFNVHKTVLAAMSPVFSAMFNIKMEEGVTNVVNIVDFEEDIVSQLIIFLYTGDLKNLDVDSASKLFAAADKYQIQSLMDHCRNFLIDQLTLKNVCDVLSLSDAHNDLNLKEASIKFICLCDKYVLVSDEWQLFERENIFLANEILRKICLHRS